VSDVAGAAGKKIGKGVGVRAYGKSLKKGGKSIVARAIRRGSRLGEHRTLFKKFGGAVGKFVGSALGGAAYEATTEQHKRLPTLLPETPEPNPPPPPNVGWVCFDSQ
jgi:hypothetical protein